MNYDEAIKKVEAIVQELEQAQALSVTEYKAKAEEAKKLLDYCEAQINGLDYSSEK